MNKSHRLTIFPMIFLGAGILLRADTLTTSRTLVLDGFLDNNGGSPTTTPENGKGSVTFNYDSANPFKQSAIEAITVSYDGYTFDLANVRHDPPIPAMYFSGWPVWNGSDTANLYAAWGPRNPYGISAKYGVHGAPSLVIFGTTFRFSPDGFIDVGPGDVCQYCLPNLIPAYDSESGNEPTYSGSVSYTPEPRFTGLVGGVIGGLALWRRRGVSATK